MIKGGEPHRRLTAKLQVRNEKTLSEALRVGTDLRLRAGISKTCYLVGNEGQGKGRVPPGLPKGKSPWKNEEVAIESGGSKFLKNHKPLVKLKIWGGHVF